MALIFSYFYLGWKILLRFSVLNPATGVSPRAIAVQSPYVAQVQLLRNKLDEIPEAAGIEVATIDSFQGREADAVIISMVGYTYT